MIWPVWCVCVCVCGKVAFFDLAESSGCKQQEDALTGADITIFQPLYNAGARVISNSWGCDPGTSRENDILPSNTKHTERGRDVSTIINSLNSNCVHSVAQLLHLRRRPHRKAGRLDLQETGNATT